MILTIAGCHCRTLRGEVFQRNPVKRDTDWVKVAGQRAATVKQDNATGTCAQEGIGRLRNWWGTEEEVCAALFHRCALKGIPGE